MHHGSTIAAIALAAALYTGSAGAQEFDESRLYAGDYDRRFRPVGIDPRFPEDA